MDENLKREIIMENYQNPKNRGLINDDSYIKQNMDSKSCIDEINLMVKLEHDEIKDIRFDGEACAICTSSTSIMIKELTNKTIAEARNKIENFKNMINEEEYNKDMLGEEIVYENIKNEPNRKNCALLAWYGIEKVLSNQK